MSKSNSFLNCQVIFFDQRIKWKFNQNKEILISCPPITYYYSTRVILAGFTIENTKRSRTLWTDSDFTYFAYFDLRKLEFMISVSRITLKKNTRCSCLLHVHIQSNLRIEGHINLHEPRDNLPPLPLHLPYPRQLFP